MSPADRVQRRTRIVVLAGLLLCILVPVAVLVVWRVRLQRAVDAELGAVKAAGYPTSGVELNTWYAPVPDNENAALALTRAFDLMRHYPDHRSNEIVRFKPPPRGQVLTPEQRDLLTGDVELNTVALAKAREALRLPKSRYPVDWSPGFTTSLRHLTKAKSLARTAEFESLLALDAGLSQGAVAPLTTMLGVAGTLEPEPDIISQFVRVAILRMAVQTVERGLALGGFSEAELGELSVTLAAAEKTNLMRRALIGERAITVPTFRMGWADIQRMAAAGEAAERILPGSPLPGRRPLVLTATAFKERDLLLYLRTLKTNIDLAALSAPGSLLAKDLTDQAARKAEREFCFFSSLFLPSISGVAAHEAASLAHLRASLGAVAVERFRRATGRLPGNLTELCPRFLPAVPKDPFDDAPLRYRLLPKGYVVYSIGPDRSDDGGAERPIAPSRGRAKPYDITVTVER